jgi:putative glutamine amidotransferase
LLVGCDLCPLPVPNNRKAAEAILGAVSVDAVLLTGGNDLESCGGDAPERDETEVFLLEYAMARGMPVLGVCRGMQVIQARYGISLRRVEGHVRSEERIVACGSALTVNSYHKFAAVESHPPLVTWATAEDGVIKAVRHAALPVVGIMWHPERPHPGAVRDRAFIRGLLSAAGGTDIESLIKETYGA